MVGSALDSYTHAHLVVGRSEVASVEVLEQIDLYIVANSLLIPATWERHGSGFTTLEIPVPIRTLKSSNVGLG